MRKTLILVAYASLSLAPTYLAAINCVCQDKHGDNIVHINDYTGSSCNDMLGNGNNSLTIMTPLTGNTNCSNSIISKKYFSCSYSFARVHIASCKEE